MHRLVYMHRLVIKVMHRLVIKVMHRLVIKVMHRLFAVKPYKDIKRAFQLYKSCYFRDMIVCIGRAKTMKEKLA